MSRLVTLDFYPTEFRFCAAHFTIFSPTHRERWHGHNYKVAASVTAPVNDPGLSFDYRLFKNKIKKLCRYLHTFFLLPENSPYLMIVKKDPYYEVEFDRTKMFFLIEDTLILPIVNTTLEDLSEWFVHEILLDKEFIDQHNVQHLAIKVFNGESQSASAEWSLN